MRFGGAKQVRIGESGDLMVDDMIQKRPVIYQDNPRREIAGRYVLLGRNTVGVRVGGVRPLAPAGDRPGAERI